MSLYNFIILTKPIWSTIRNEQRFFFLFAVIKLWNAIWRTCNQCIPKMVNGIKNLVAALKSSLMVIARRKRCKFETINLKYLFIIPVAQWKKLIAKVVTTKERFKVGDPDEHDASPIPGIELYDIIDGGFFNFNS